MSHPSHRTGCVGRLVLLLGVRGCSSAVVWHSRQDRLERSLTSLGARSVLRRAANAPRC